MYYISFKPQNGASAIIASPIDDMELFPIVAPLVEGGFTMCNIINVTDDVVASSIPLDEFLDYLNVKKDLKNQIQPLTAEEENLLKQLQDENDCGCL